MVVIGDLTSYVMFVGSVRGPTHEATHVQGGIKVRRARVRVREIEKC